MGAIRRKPAPTQKNTVSRLNSIRNRFDTASSQEKLDLMRRLNGLDLHDASEFTHLHSALCFIRAFPDTPKHHDESQSLLATFEEKITSLPIRTRDKLWDTGIAGTQLNYRFSYEVATWLARRVSGSVSIDWDEVDDTSNLDEILELLLQACELDHFNSGLITSREWLDNATAGTEQTDFDWLLAQLGDEHLRSVWAQIYNTADVPLTWQLAGDGNLTTRNVLPVSGLVFRRNGLRKITRTPKKEIMQPINSLRTLSPSMGEKMIDVAMTSLAVRHRETYHFSYANPREVHVADVGEGVSVAVFGMQEQHRYPLECTMGFLILSNGIPIGYGGASALFRQINTGINLFDEYRGSEAAFLWAQVMRVYRQLFECTRFVANPYQFGSENSEALRSGAFWFYYRLGFRPVDPAVKVLARRESARLRLSKSKRSNIKTLDRLASCDMHLTLPGSRPSDLIEEDWIDVASMLASNELSAVGCKSRNDAIQKVGANVAREIGLRNINRWTDRQRCAYHQLAPIVAATKPALWPQNAKCQMRSLLRGKAGAMEADYARLMPVNEFFFKKLRKACKSAH